MLRHIVFFSARDPADLERIEAGLRLLEGVPGPLVLEVRRNLGRDQLGNAIDLVVYGEFADQAALDAYKAHPRYAETIAIVRPLRELRFAVDIEAGPPGGNPGG